MTAVGERPAEDLQGAKRKKTPIIIGAATLVAAALAAGAFFATKTDGPQSVAAGYLEALKSGDGAKAKGFLGGDAAADLTDRSLAAFADASARISDVKAGKDAGADVVETGDQAQVKISYTLADQQVQQDLKLMKDQGRGWVITNPNLITVAQHKVPAVTQTVTIGKTTKLDGEDKITLLPAEYPLAYSGSPYFKLAAEKLATSTESLTMADDAKVETALAAKVSAAVAACAATGKSAPSVAGKSCGFLAPGASGVLMNPKDTDVTSWKIAAEPSARVVGKTWTGSFKVGGHRTSTSVQAPLLNVDKDFEPVEVKLEGLWDFNTSGEPSVSSAFAAAGSRSSVAAPALVG